MATGSSWYPPLPSGWEARWDPNQKAYFFIDHVNKGTSWEDPRWKKTSQPEAAQALGHSGGTAHHATGQREAIPMRDFQRTGNAGQTQSQDTSFFNDREAAFVKSVKDHLPTCPESVIKQSLLKHFNHVNATIKDLKSKGYTKEDSVVELSNTATGRLKELFPAAPSGVIQDVLAMCGNDEEDARVQLADLGFQMSGGGSHSVSPAASPHRHESTGHRRHSGHQSRHNAPQSRQPAKLQLSDSDKARVKSKLQSEFASIDKDVIVMALESADYNEESCRRILKSLGKTERVPSSTSTRAESRTTNFTPVAMTSNASLAPAAFEDTLANSGRRSASRETTPSRSAASTSSHGRTRGPTQQQKAKQVTMMSEQLLSTTNDMLNHLASSCCLRDGEGKDAGDKVAQHQSTERKTHTRAKPKKQSATPARRVITAQPQIHHSLYKTVANGPNPNLRKGPDASLLTSDYATCNGPNPDIRMSPDPSLATGSKGALGPDPSLRCGPRSELCQGTRSDSYSVDTYRPMLVSAI